MAHVSLKTRILKISQQDKCYFPVRKTNFAYAFRPIYLVSRAFGLLPFSIVYHPNGDILNVRVSRLDGIWFGISLCLYLFGIYSSLLYISHSPNLKLNARILNIAYGSSYVLGFIFGFLSVILDMRNRFQLIGIIKKFIIFDKEASQIKLRHQFFEMTYLQFFSFNLLICIHFYRYNP